MGLFSSDQSGSADPNTARQLLVDHMQARGDLTSPRVLAAFRSVPRHLFLPESDCGRAYEDRALPLIEGQTISQPSMIALMLEALDCRPDDRALEIGAGCGYAAALLGRLCAEVHAVEIRPALAKLAQATLARLETANVRLHISDGGHGLPEHAPFDRILVSAAAGEVPRALVEQLAPGGRMAIPVDDRNGQILMVGEKRPLGELRWTRSVPCLFVPLVSLPPG